MAITPDEAKEKALGIDIEKAKAAYYPIIDDFLVQAMKSGGNFPIRWKPPYDMPKLLLRFINNDYDNAGWSVEVDSFSGTIVFHLYGFE